MASHTEGGPVLESPRVVVGLDFGTTTSGFAFVHVSEPDKISTFYDYPNSGGEKPYCKTPTASYYKKDNSTDGGGRYQLKSWGYSARAEYERDIMAARRQILSSGPSRSSLLPNVGIYLSKLRLHLASSSVTKLPPWLTVEALITDYLREMGVLILNRLRETYGPALTKDKIQWCITVPSIWDNYAKELMKTCMTGAGLVNGVDGSPHPLNIVLELEAASFHCLKCMSQCTLEVGDRLLVVDIGFETTDIVVQEVVSMAPTYKVKEVTTSSRGLCGGAYLDTRFMEFLHKKIGPCLQECLNSHPNISRMLIKTWEYQKTSFGDQHRIGEGTEIVLPMKVVTAWEKYDENMDLPERDSYDELEITYEEMQSIFDPVVEQNLELIADQLKQVDSRAVKVLVVVGEFAGSPYLVDNIKRRFDERVPQILSPPNPGTAVCQGAVALTLSSHAIESRIRKRTYGFSCTYKFEHDVDPVEYMKVVDGVAKCRMAKYGPAIGIDLGTTNCRVGIWLDEENRFELISNEPSYVSFTETERLIGDAAKEQVCRNPTNTVFDAKRLIGRKFSDLGTDVDEMHIQWPFKVTRGKDDRPMVHVEYKGKEKAFSPIDICSMLLVKLKDLAEVHSGSVVDTACVSVPHCFTYEQRMAMRSVCSLAGFQDVRLVNEAVCAALGYTLQTIDPSVGERKVVIFDLGGGSLDISLLSIKEREIEVKATSGDSQLGGEDFDLRLLHHFITEIKENYVHDITRHPRVVRRLKKQVERVKIRLSTEPEAFLLIESLLEDFTFYSTITRTCFEQMNADLFARIMACVQDCLERARLERKDVDEVMLIGGSSRIPKVVELLTAFFDGSKLNTGINPDEAVVCGAAIADGCGAFQVVDVLPMSLGLERQQQLQTSRLRSTSFSASSEASSGEFSGLLRGVENAESPHDRPELRRGATTGVDESHHLTKAEDTRSATSPQLGSDSVIEDVVKKYTWGQVLSMTNNLSKSIGKGGFGAVYLGKLDNEKEVAVKVLDANSQQGLTEFLNEVNLLKRVNYVYLVRLLGYCLDTKQVLIYEYAEEGSIWDHLRVGGKILDWKTRLKVALESACGLEYLHTGCHPRIIHRDIKSQNILLTKSMVAKVADFGLSKLGADQDNVSKTHVTTMVKGTLGYLDPEYLRTGQLTEKSDVYSFGVVLLEIITGRKPIKNTDRKGFIGDWVEDLYNSNNNSSRHLKHIVDPTLGSYYNSKALKLVVNIAKDCIQPHGIDRPEMTKVVNILRKAQMIEHDEKKPSKWLPFL